MTVVPLDDFYQTTVPESMLPDMSVPERLDLVFDWDRVREGALLPLRRRRAGRWRAFDFVSGLSENGTYGLSDEPTWVAPAPVVLLDGAYSAAPPLSDLVDLSVLVDVSMRERHRRTAKRDEPEFLRYWHAIWDDVEAYYFDQVRPPQSFDLIVRNHPVDPLPPGT